MWTVEHEERAMSRILGTQGRMVLEQMAHPGVNAITIQLSPEPFLICALACLSRSDCASNRG